MNFIQWFYHTFVWKKSKKPQKIHSIVPEFKFSVIVEYDTVEYKLALDSGMDIVSSDRDMHTFVGDLITYSEYLNLVSANQRAIKREFNKRYHIKDL